MPISPGATPFTRRELRLDADTWAVTDQGAGFDPEVLEVADEEALVLELLEAGLYLHPGYFYGYERGAHVMLSALTDE